MKELKCPKCGAHCTSYANNGWQQYSCGYEVGPKAGSGGFAMLAVMSECKGKSEDAKDPGYTET